MTTTENPPSPRRRLEELFAKVDAFFARASAAHGEAITCHAGCDDCCRRRFSVTVIEADVIREALSRLSSERRRALAERAAREDDAACPALDPDGRCAIYEARPLICRTHGLPIRFRPEGARSLPLLDACSKNFVGRDLGSLDPTTVLDQSTLSTVLGALSAVHAGASGERIGIAELCAEACSSYEPV
jgi:uncharacterized protein